MSDNTPPPQVWPTLRARDARALIRFLVDAFGFEETVVYGDGDVVHHAQLSWPPGGGVMLGSVREGQPEDSWPVPPGTFGAYVVTDDPDGVYARATAAGRGDHRRAARDRLRLPRLRGARPGRQPLVLRHLPRRAPQIRLTRGAPGSGGSLASVRPGCHWPAGSGNLGFLSRIGHDDRDVRPYCPVSECQAW